MNEAEINRMIAKQAARGIYLYAHQQQGTSDLRARLLAEAKATDRFYCSDDEMVVMAEAEYRKLRGNALGGHVAYLSEYPEEGIFPLGDEVTPNASRERTATGD